MKPKHVNTLIVLAVIAGVAYGFYYINKQKQAAAASSASAATTSTATKTV